MALTKEQIDALDDVTIEEIEVPEWENTVFIRTMSGDERDEYLDSVVDMSGDKPKPKLLGTTARLVALCLCDEKGKRLYTGAAVKRLGEKNAAALERIGRAATKLNALDADAVERLAKNSESVPSDAKDSD